MKKLKRVRRGVLVGIQKFFNALVITALVLQPVGTPGLLGVFSLSPLAAVAQEAEATDTADITSVDQSEGETETAPSAEEVPASNETTEVSDEVPTPADENSEIPVDTPSETPSDTPVEPTEETPTDEPTETPSDVPAESDGVESPDSPGETPSKESPTPTPTDDTPVVEEPAPADETTASVEGAVTETPAEETVCLSASVVVSEEDDWEVSGETAKTKENVKLGVRYIYPLDKDVTVTFTCLPADESERAPLSIERIPVNEIDFPDGIVAVSEYAYDITTDGMENGTFKYDLSLPKIASGEATISYIQKSADEIKGKTLSHDEVKKITDEQVDNEGESVEAEDLDHFTSFVVTQQAIASAIQTTTGACMEDAQGGNLQCTANDVSIASVTGIAILDDGCAFPGDTVTFKATWNVQSGANQRYDVGLYFAANGQTSALNGTCSISTLANSPVPPWFNFDNDACGDIQQNTTLSPEIEMTVACIDTNNDNLLNLPYCTSWDNNQNGVCNGPAEALPGTGSKCNCQNGFQVPITVPFVAKIEVVKSLVPSNNTGKFNLQIDGVNKATDVGNNGTTGPVTVSAGTSASPGATYTVSETAGTGTSLSDYVSAISCVKRGTATVVASASGAGPLNVPVQKDDDIVCTITNTLPSGTITILKDTVPNDAQDFAFTTTGTGLASFSLDDDADGTLSNTKTFTGILPGTYTVTEVAQAGFQLGNLVCVDPTTNSTVDVGTRTATINLSASETVTCTFTNNKQPRLTLVKEVTNDNGGTAVATAWTLNAIGPTPISGTTESASVTNAIVDAGTYTLSETGGPAGYAASAWNCVGGTQNGSDITLANGQSATCTITNDDQAASLTVIKHVINDNGGTKGSGDFTMNVTGTDVSDSSFPGAENPGTTVTLDAGSYAVDEGSVFGYAKMLGENCSGTIALGESKTCTITNNDIQPQLTVIKIVENNDGGNLQSSDFTMSVSGNSASPSDFPGSAAGTQVSLNQGSYSVTETLVSGYVPQYSADCNGTILVGETKTCTVTNADQAPTLTLIKTVVNNNGGNKQVADFPLFVNGNPVTSGVAVTLQANALYTTSETSLAGYAASAWGGDCAADGTITLLSGQSATCTITNDDIQPQLTVTKVVENDGFGTKQVADFPLFVDETNVVSGVQNGFNAGAYTVSETNQPGYTATISGDCAANGSVTLAVGDVKSCTITNNDGLGKIIVEKQTLPDGSAQVFSFTPSYDEGFALSDGQQNTSTPLPAGTYSVNESVPAGWDLTSVICSDESPANAISLGDGETVTCVFTNTKRGNITIVKDAINNDAQNFTFNNNFGNGHPATFLLDDDSNGGLPKERTFEVLPGIYTVSEDAVAGWQQESTICDNDETIDSIDVNPGEAVTCTFVNEELATIVLVKNTVGGDDSFDFDATGAGLPTDIDLTTVDGTASQAFSDLDQDNTYSLTENVPAGWDQTSASCTGTNTPGSITPDPGETVTCTFVNTKRGTIIVEKQTDPDGNSETFEFDPSWSEDNFFLADNLQTNVGSLVPGPYSVTELTPTGWDLTSVLCTSSKGDKENPGNIDLQAGETVTCVFTNTKQGKIIVKKETNPDQSQSETVQSFVFDPSWSADNFSLVDGDQHDSGFLSPGVYGVTELDQPGWDLTAVTCVSNQEERVVDGSDELEEVPVDQTIDPNAIVLGAGETITCTFLNTEEVQPVCGDGIINQESEQCDGTAGVTPGVNFCTFSCQLIPVYDGGDACSPGTEPVLVTSKFVSGTAPAGLTPTTLSLSGGTEYLIEATGTYSYGGVVPDNLLNRADAGYSSDDDFAGPSLLNSLFGISPGATYRGIHTLISDWGTGTYGVVNWGSYDPTHTYPVNITPALNTDINFLISDWYDTWYSGDGLSDTNKEQAGYRDNEGGLTLNLYECQEPRRGSITVIKDAIPDHEQNFGFVLNPGFVEFVLDDDSDPLLSNSFTQSELAADTYTVTEGLVPGWTLDSVTCTSDQRSLLSTTDPVRTIDLLPGENIVCTFTNKAANGSITIIKDAVPDDPQNFGYAMNGAGFVEFVLDDDADPLLSNTATFTSLAPGTYTVTEGLVPGWTLANITCTSNLQELSPSTDPIRTIELGVGEQVTCTFYNNLDEKEPVCGDGTINQESEQCDGTAGVTPGVNFCTFSCQLIPVYDGGDVCAEGEERVKVASYFVESFMTDGVVPAPINVPLQGGKQYELEATGDFGYGGVPENNALNRADAAYVTDTNWAGPNLDTLFGSPATALYRGIHALISDFGTGIFGVMNWGAYSPSHVYTLGLNPASDTNMQFAISDWYDTWYSGDALSDFNKNQFGFRDNEGGITLNLYECVAGEPELIIAKSNSVDPTVQQPGDSVTYTITVTAPETNPSNITDVTVTDLPPDGFDFIPGTDVASTGSLTTTYASPGVWSLGTMAPGDVVTLSYETLIGTSQDAGTYKDLAWAKGTSATGGIVLADDPVDPDNATGDNYVGTKVAVEIPTGTNEVVLNTRVERDVDTDTVRRVKRVLGASLPDTGANTLWIALATALFAGGIGLIAWSKRRRRISASKGMAVVVFGLLALTGIETAQAAPPIVKIETPATPVATANVEIGFVTLDIENRLVGAECKQGGGPAIATLSTDYTAKNGGNSGSCLLTLPTDGAYEFFVTVTPGGDASVDSATVSVELVSASPSTPLNYSRSEGSCTVSFTTANDGLSDKVELYRSTSTSFVADASTLVATSASIGPNANSTLTDPNADCGSGYYYAIRAIAISGNGSGFTGDEGVTIDKETKKKLKTDTRRVPGPRTSSGAIPVTTTAGATAGAVEGVETTDETTFGETDQPSGAVFGEATTETEPGENSLIAWIKNHPWWSALLLLVILAIGFSVYQRRTQTGTGLGQ